MFIRSILPLVTLLAFTGVSIASAAMVSDRTIGSARIVEIKATPSADLVVLNEGFEVGLRQSMVCQVTRSGDLIGKLLLVELRPNTATALILNLNSGRFLQIGDSVAVQTVSTRNN